MKVGRGSKKGSKKAGSTWSKSSKKASLTFRGDDLSQKVFQTMEKYKDVCVGTCVGGGGRGVSR